MAKRKPSIEAEQFTLSLAPNKEKRVRLFLRRGSRFIQAAIRIGDRLYRRSTRATTMHAARAMIPALRAHIERESSKRTPPKEVQTEFQT